MDLNLCPSIAQMSTTCANHCTGLDCLGGTKKLNKNFTFSDTNCEHLFLKSSRVAVLVCRDAQFGNKYVIIYLYDYNIINNINDKLNKIRNTTIVIFY